VTKPNPVQRWFVQVGPKTYGPYSEEAMLRFIDEGRIKPTSKVSPHPDGSAPRPANEIDAFAHAFGFGRAHRAEAGEANIVVVTEVFSGATDRVLHELARLGRHVELTPGLYLLRTRHTSGAVRNTLSQAMERGDKFLVVDATRDRLAWYNMGPEVDVRIKEIWNVALAAND
jgi:hypothetical protein